MLFRSAPQQEQAEPVARMESQRHADLHGRARQRPDARRRTRREADRKTGETEGAVKIVSSCEFRVDTKRPGRKIRSGLFYADERGTENETELRIGRLRVYADGLSQRTRRINMKQDARKNTRRRNRQKRRRAMKKYTAERKSKG